MEKSIFTIFTGDDKTMNLKAVYEETGDPLDLTDCDEIVVALPLADGSFTALALSDGDVSITPPDLLGKFTCPVASEVSTLLNPGELQSFDVTFTIATKIFTVRYYNSLTVLERG